MVRKGDISEAKEEKFCVKEESNLLCSGSLQLSRQLEEPTNCSSAKAYSLAEPVPGWTITFTGETRADKIVYTIRNATNTTANHMRTSDDEEW